MKSVFFTLITSVFIWSCAVNKHASSKEDETGVLLTAMADLETTTGQKHTAAALPGLYKNFLQSHKEKIDIYSRLSDLTKWEKIAAEYIDLQIAYALIKKSPAASAAIPAPENFEAAAHANRQQAAAAFYAAGMEGAGTGTKEEWKKAYYHFKTCNDFVPGYKDVADKMATAYEKGATKVVLVSNLRDPLQNESSNDSAAYYNKERFVYEIANNLAETTEENGLFAFYTQRELNNENLQPDVTISLDLVNIELPAVPAYQNTAVDYKAQAVVGADKAGNPVLGQVTATEYVSRASFFAWAEIEMAVSGPGVKEKKTKLRTGYGWSSGENNFTGDERAIRSSVSLKKDINKPSSSFPPGREEVLAGMYKALGPQIKTAFLKALE